MRRLVSFAFAMVFLLVGGCSDDKSTTAPTIDPDPEVLSTTPDLLAQHFVESWTERNFVRYDAMVHEDFVFYFAPEDVSLSPFGLGFWERAFEIDSTERMFNGSEGLRPDGTIQPGVQAIDLFLSSVQPTWEDASGEGAEYVGTLKRRYEVDMTVDYTAGDLISEVTGEQVFYVKAVPTDVEGELVDVYKLIFWRDLGRPVGKAGVESTSFGKVKALF